MGEVVYLASRRSGSPEQPLNYRELSAVLPSRPSIRWLKYRKAEGMPDAGLNWKGERVFYSSLVSPWLDEWARRNGRVLSPSSESADQGET